jgi:hypothetical protein
MQIRRGKHTASTEETMPEIADHAAASTLS